MTNQRSTRHSSRVPAIAASQLLLTLLLASVLAFAQAPQVAYQWGPVHLVAGGYVPGIAFHPAQKGLIYARTDIGGAYRWDEGAHRWFPLNDSVGLDNLNDLGIEGLALDPKDPAKLYLAVGTYTKSWAPDGAILRSDDQGKTFARTPLPFKLGGNEDGRGSGPRLVVDPQNSKVLYLGTRHNGLWRSTDGAATWAKIDSFPTFADNGIGVISVFPIATDGTATRSSIDAPVSKNIYAAVSAPDGGLMRSTDGGQTWTRVPKQPSKLLITNAALASNDVLYLTYGNAPGPMGEESGAVWRLDLANGKWTDITPSVPGAASTDGAANPKFAYAGVAVSASNPQILFVSTLDRWYPGDAIFRSIDGGKHWVDIASGQQPRYEGLSPWLNHANPIHGAGSWPTTLAIDPFDPSHVLYATGETVWETREANALDSRSDPAHPVRWYVDAAGIEETAIRVLLSPPTGPHLVSGMLDIGGFRHDELNQSPRTGSFKNPELNDTTGIAYAANDPAIMVRVGGSFTGSVFGGYSHDQGLTWKPFASQPAGTKGSGSVAITADGKSVLWASEGAPVSLSKDMGNKWAAIAGMPLRARVVADPINSAKLYIYGFAEGIVLLSSDAGATFHTYAEGLAKAELFDQPAIYATPGREGDLWVGSGQGLFHSPEPGKPFAKVASVEMIHSLGFGMAAKDKTDPTLFIFGRLHGIAAIYASIDWGKSWIRIDDDAHRFGDVRCITGDPRIFGRVYIGTEGRGILAADSSARLDLLSHL